MQSSRVGFQVRPPTTSGQPLRQQRAIYRQGRTPVVDPGGGVRALDVAPANAATAAWHLGEIATHFGPEGLGRSIRGLDLTRGRAFTDQTLRLAPIPLRSQIPLRAIGASPAAGEPMEGLEVDGGRAGPWVALAVARSRPSGTPPAEVATRLPEGHRFDQVAVHDDAAAHVAADLLHARAFTLGRSVYFARGEYQPSTSAGFDLLAHELAHTAQQQDSASAAVEHLAVTTPTSVEETQAAAFASAVRDGRPVPDLVPGPGGITRIMRQVGFTLETGMFELHDPGTAETATTFQIAAGKPVEPHFRWAHDVTIHGNAGDPFGDFEVGPHQVVRDYWFNVWWGDGDNRSSLTAKVNTPIRDAATVDSTWYHDGLISKRFTGPGDLKTTEINDSPGEEGISLANPVFGRQSTRGWFNWGMAFVAYISARDATKGTGADAFQALGHVYWNLSLEGSFDTTKPAGHRVTVTGGGKVNHSGAVLGGASTEFPSMHGGTTFKLEATAAQMLR